MNYIPDPVREKDKPFLMSVEDVFTITGRGTVATGCVERGVVKLEKKWKSLVSTKTRKLLLQDSKCSVNN